MHQIRFRLGREKREVNVSPQNLNTKPKGEYVIGEGKREGIGRNTKEKVYAKTQWHSQDLTIRGIIGATAPWLP